ncbi:RNA polymerase factor sigma-54 [Aquamicrobium defluvii]|uniref:RNA polymerase sigma-54 factor n=2 Tax=Aquamicrobium defluvii TaxID=69279 RepID=A0A011V0I4_9HYPH|nr:RNA polymerase sigma-54 factor [Aquamicrobium defluvii]EXL01905.1 RNA polymerase subunit sigma-54 [Aquamicrobium defluvii]EZQ12881.1 RNA polymerase subunit sigma-54 [Halopseudomonas bauzanensis]
MASLQSGLAQVQKRRLAMTPAMRGQIELVTLDAFALEAHLMQIFDARPDVEMRPSQAYCIERLFPARKALRPGEVPAGNGLAGEMAVARNNGLQGHVFEQIGLLFSSRDDRSLALDLAGHLAPTGWLETDDATLRALLPWKTNDHYDRVLARLQEMEPAGLFARNLSECLILQARDQELLDPVMEAVLENLPLLASGRVDRIAAIAGTSAEEVMRRFRQIRGFDPKPGLRFGDEAPLPEPDVILRKVNGAWRAALNPRLRCEWRSIDKSAEAEMSALRGVVAFRESTLLRIAEWFCANQSALLEGGLVALRPMTRRALAQELDLHETTVGRALRHRLIQTPMAMYSFDALFGPPLQGVSGTPEAGHAPQAVMARLKNLISHEDSENPLSDRDLAARLRQDGIVLARRTVAKYRAALGIESVSVRQNG